MPDPIISWNADLVIAAVADKVERGMNLCVAALATEASQMVSVPGGGRASAPGQPPALQSGTLAANIGYEVERGADEIRGCFGVRADVAYALRLELGFAGLDSLGRHYNQAPRPFLRPALLSNREMILELIAEG